MKFMYNGNSYFLWFWMSSDSDISTSRSRLCSSSGRSNWRRSSVTVTASSVGLSCFTDKAW